MAISDNDLNKAKELIEAIISSVLQYQGLSAQIRALTSQSTEDQAKLDKLSKELENISKLENNATQLVQLQNSVDELRKKVENNKKELADNTTLQQKSIDDFETGIKLIQEIQNVPQISTLIDESLKTNFSLQDEENRKKIIEGILNANSAKGEGKKDLESLGDLISRALQKELSQLRAMKISSFDEINELIQDTSADFKEKFIDWAGENGENYIGINPDILKKFGQDFEKISKFLDVKIKQNNIEIELPKRIKLDKEYFEFLHKQTVVNGIANQISTAFHKKGTTKRITDQDSIIIAASIAEYAHQYPSEALNKHNLLQKGSKLAAAATAYMLKQKDNNIFHAHNAKVGQKVSELRHQAICHAIQEVAGRQDYQAMYNAEQAAIAEQMAIAQLHNTVNTLTILPSSHQAVANELDKMDGNTYVSKLTYLKEQVFEKALKEQNITDIKDPLLIDLHKEFNKIAKANPEATPEQLKQLMTSAARGKVQADKQKMIEDYNKFVDKITGLQQEKVQRLYSADVAEKQSVYEDCGLSLTDEELNRIYARSDDNRKLRLAEMEYEVNKLKRTHTTKRMEVAAQGFELAIAGMIVGLPFAFLTIGFSVIVGGLIGMLAGAMFDYRKQKNHCEKEIQAKLDELHYKYQEEDLKAKNTLRDSLERKRDGIITDNKALLKELNEYKSGKTTQNQKPNKHLTRIQGVYGEKHGVVLELRSYQKLSKEVEASVEVGSIGKAEKKFVVFELKASDLFGENKADLLKKLGLGTANGRIFTIGEDGAAIEVVRDPKNQDAKVKLYIDEGKAQSFQKALEEAKLTTTGQPVKHTENRDLIAVRKEQFSLVLPLLKDKGIEIDEMGVVKQEGQLTQLIIQNDNAICFPVDPAKAPELIKEIEKLTYLQPTRYKDGAPVREAEQNFLKTHRDCFRGNNGPVEKALAKLGITVKTEDGVLSARDGQGNKVMTYDSKGFYHIKLNDAQYKAAPVVLAKALGESGKANSQGGIQHLRNSAVFQQSAKNLSEVTDNEDVNQPGKPPKTPPVNNPNQQGGPKFYV